MATRARRKLKVVETAIDPRHDVPKKRKKQKHQDETEAEMEIKKLQIELQSNLDKQDIRIEKQDNLLSKQEEQIQDLVVENMRLKVQTERMKGTVRKSKLASLRTGEFLLQMDRKLNESLFKLSKEIDSVGYAIQGMAESCIICGSYPNLGPGGNARSWIVPRCGHPVCSGCVRDVLDLRISLCLKCRQPLYDYSYHGTTMMQTLKMNMDTTLHKIRCVQDDVKGFSPSYDE